MKKIFSFLLFTVSIIFGQNFVDVNRNVTNTPAIDNTIISGPKTHLLLNT